MSNIKREASAVSHDPRIVAVGEAIFEKVLAMGMTNGEVLQALMQVMLFLLTEACDGNTLKAADVLAEMVRNGRRTLIASQSVIIVERGPGAVKAEREEDADRLEWLAGHYAYVMGVDNAGVQYHMNPPKGDGDLRAAIDHHRARLTMSAIAPKGEQA